MTVLCNPHEPEVERSAERVGEQKKEWAGYKVKVAEPVEDSPIESGKPSTQCSRLEDVDSGKVSSQFEWSWLCREACEHACVWIVGKSIGP